MPSTNVRHDAKRSRSRDPVEVASGIHDAAISHCARGEYVKARPLCLRALRILRSVLGSKHPDVANDPDTIVNEFRARFVEPKLFWDRFHHGQFANYFFNRHYEGPDPRFDQQTAHQLAEEAQLFIDAAHKCHAKLLEQTRDLVQITI